MKKHNYIYIVCEKLFLNYAISYSLYVLTYGFIHFPSYTYNTLG